MRPFPSQLPFNSHGKYTHCRWVYLPWVVPHWLSEPPSAGSIWGGTLLSTNSCPQYKCRPQTADPLLALWKKKRKTMRHTLSDWTKCPPKKTHLVGAACYSNPQLFLLLMSKHLWYMLKWAWDTFYWKTLCVDHRHHCETVLGLYETLRTAPDCSKAMICTVCATHCVDCHRHNEKEHLFNRAVAVGFCGHALAIPRWLLCDAEFGLFIYPSLIQS